MSPIYHSLHFVLLFPTGQLGWHPKLIFGDSEENEAHEGQEEEEEGAEQILAPGEESNDRETGDVVAVRKKRKYMSQTEFFCYQLFHQQNESDHIFCVQHLFQEYIVDCWTATEQSRLGFFFQNQDTIHTDLYQGVMDAAANNDT